MAQAVLCGVSSLLRPDALVAARGLWQAPGPSRLFDAAVAGMPDSALPWLRELVEEFCRDADLTVLGIADVTRLFGPVPPLRAARRLRAMGRGAVLLACGPAVSVLICDDPGGRPRADGPADVLIGLPFTPTLPNLQAALGSGGVPWDAPGWLDLAEKAAAA
ncbi:hypothetical protein [Catellatospora citrea]|uniref:Uncharacterized protein n=1 Tax=Catellatospora citrea TaxID=53366 RepID=A0A8J3K886_9ACTN|nr:hypothetical protein [Catellatospora citrea]RKE06907.1 hypothetical protein C8E86_1731 [Catellatospora citrea]GIF95056.1 hypothetical protein Cci01nite_01500 [Catellatospora citrea]